MLDDPFGLDEESQSRPMQPGDMGVCSACGGGHVVDENGNRRKPTADEVDDFDSDPRIVAIRARIEMLHRLEPIIRRMQMARFN